MNFTSPETALKDIFNFEFKSPVDQKKLLSKFKQLFDEVESWNTIGHLFAICVPKKEWNRRNKNPQEALGYLSHARGEPCKCYPNDINDEIITKLQNCSSKQTGIPIHQFRLIMSKFIARPAGVRIFDISPFTQAQKKFVREQVQALAREVYSKSKR